MLTACLHRRIVNPDILVPGAPGNTGKAPASTPPPQADPIGDLIVLGTNTVTLAAGTSLSARLEDVIDTSKNRSGDSFEATLVEALAAGGATVAPAGTPLRGQITDVRTAEPGTPAEISLNLLEISINNRWFPLQTELLIFRAAGDGNPPSSESAGLAPDSDPSESHIFNVGGTSIALPAGQTLAFRLIRRAALEGFGAEAGR